MGKVRKILMVEDDRDFATSLGLLLQMKGYDVIPAGSGEEALDLYGDAIYCLVLMDIKLPGLSGIETMERLLQTDPDARVLLMTGCERGSEDVVSANLNGACGVLYKPFRINDLLGLIET